MPKVREFLRSPAAVFSLDGAASQCKRDDGPTPPHQLFERRALLLHRARTMSLRCGHLILMHVITRSITRTTTTTPRRGRAPLGRWTLFPVSCATRAKKLAVRTCRIIRHSIMKYTRRLIVMTILRLPFPECP